MYRKKKQTNNSAKSSELKHGPALVQILLKEHASETSAGAVNKTIPGLDHPEKRLRSSPRGVQNQQTNPKTTTEELVKELEASEGKRVRRSTMTRVLHEEESTPDPE